MPEVVTTAERVVHAPVAEETSIQRLSTAAELPLRGVFRGRQGWNRYHRGGRFSLKAWTPSSAASSIMLQAMVWPASM